jgi:hypothetical protein
MNEERIPKKVLNMNIKGKCVRGRPRLRWEYVRKDVTQKEGKTWGKILDDLWEDYDSWAGFVVR